MIDPNTAMSAAKEGAKAVSKFEEIIQKVFGPKWTKRQADADAYADERKLQTIRDNPDMEIVYANGQINARVRDPEALAIRARQRQLIEAVREEENIESILEIAGDELTTVETVSDEPVDEDWTARFFYNIKDISSSEMQLIWGKILTGEIVKPGSFSLRTLDIIRNISKREAEAFQSIQPFTISDGSHLFLPTDHELLEKYKIPYQSILLLDECGLINSDGFNIISFSVNCDTINAVFTHEYILKISTNTKELKEVKLNTYMLSTAAKELQTVLSFTTNYDYLCDYADNICKKNHATVNIHKVTAYDKRIGTISYNHEPCAKFPFEE